VQNVMATGVAKRSLKKRDKTRNKKTAAFATPKNLIKKLPAQTLTLQVIGSCVWVGVDLA